MESHHQNGGLEPLNMLPEFKYTFDEERKIFISHIYPYADYFIKCVTDIPFNTYSYNGPCELIHYEQEPKIQDIFDCETSGKVSYAFTGGSVYEIINKKYQTPKLHDYCDATGDIDVIVQPPKLMKKAKKSSIDEYEYEEYFFNVEGNVNKFYNNFIRWLFKKFVAIVKTNLSVLKDYNGIVDFNLNEYSEIPIQHKKENLGYLSSKIHNKFHIVAFLNDDRTMFKIQLVIKIKSGNISVIDHAIEMIIPINSVWPNANQFCITDDSYKQKDHVSITINDSTYRVQGYNSLISDNISAFIERKRVFGTTNEKQYVHKPLNHIARLLYLYELFYKNQSSFNFNKLYLSQLAIKKKELEQIKTLIYYERTHDYVKLVNIDLKIFLRAYYEILKKNDYDLNSFKIKAKQYLNDDTFFDNITKDEHDKFIDLYGSNRYSLIKKSASKRSASRKRSGKRSASRGSSSRGRSSRGRSSKRSASRGRSSRGRSSKRSASRGRSSKRSASRGRSSKQKNITSNSI